MMLLMLRFLLIQIMVILIFRFKSKSIILDNIRQGILLLDDKLKFLFINQEAEEILGKSSRALKKNNALKNIDKEIVKLIKGVKKNNKTKFVS